MAQKRRLKKSVKGALAIVALLIVTAIVAIVLTKVFSKDKSIPASSNKTEQNTEEQVADTEAPTTEFPEEVTITITAVGDCTLGSDIQMVDSSESFVNRYNENGPDYFMANFKSIFESDDLTIANLESTITDQGERVPDKTWCFRGDPEYVKIFTGSSVEAVSFANNHCHDYGEISYTDTMKNLDEAGILYSSEDIVCVTEIKGIKVGMISIQSAFRSGDAGYDKEYPDIDFLKQITDEYIKKVKDQGAQLVIMNYHWGIEKEYLPSSQQKELGHYAIDAGADVIIGHHPHRVQSVEKYKDSYIVYSLGNFCFGGNHGPSDMDAFAWKQTFTFKNGELVLDDNAYVIPCSISSNESRNNFQPTPSTGDEYVRIMNKINEKSQGFGVQFSTEDGHAIVDTNESDE